MALTRPAAQPAASPAQAQQPAATIASQVQKSGNSYSAAPAQPKPSAPLDPQAQADRAKIGSAWDTVKGWNDDAGRAIADVASLVPRGVVGAYDSAVVRPMRAAGVNAVYLSPKLVPDGVDPSSMTPFTDQKRIAANVDPSASRPASTVQTPPQGNQPDAKKPDQPKPVDAVNPDAREISPGIYRQGNSYGDSPEAATTGARPSQGPSPRNRSIAEALATRSTGQQGQPTDVMGIYARASEAMKGAAQVQREIDGNQSQRGPGSTFINHSGNDWEAENNLKNLRTSASSIFNKRGPRGAPSVEEMAYMKALDADFAARNGNNPAAIEAMKQQGDIQQTGMRESGENARSGRRDGIAAELGRGQLDLQRSAQGFTTRQLERQEKLSADYDAAKTPEDRATIAQKIRDLSGKNTDPKDNFMAVGGGQEWDPAAGAMRNVPQRLVDLRTGREVGGGSGAKPMAMPKTPDELKVGQVYDTNKGPATWDGKQFTAVAG